ncbi:hypothetical protein UACE39S_02954 [Ureibacillus acetophenoni]|uniref:aspartyl-phosphate phosphatase Spo0E family protein n=1 Tax=Ureibacillus sp. MALMAid1270 TaxID=3411629 RepID=UPI003BA642FB
MTRLKFDIELLKDIESTRKSMIQVGAAFGLTHPETIKLSQQLDQLLNRLDNDRMF